MATDWHELVLMWRIMQPSIAGDSRQQFEPRCSMTDTTVRWKKHAHVGGGWCIDREHSPLFSKARSGGAEPRQDSGYAVGFSTAAGQSQRLRSASGVDMHASTSQKRRVTTVWSSTASCCCHTGGRGVSQWLLPTTAASTARPIHVCRGGTYAGQGVHFVSPTVVPVFYFINFEFDIL